ncbi:MAG: trypsin-like serine protease [Pseudomonadota bacterium]
MKRNHTQNAVSIATTLIAILFQTGCMRNFHISESSLLLKGGRSVSDQSDPIARSTVALVLDENLASGKTHCSGTLIDTNVVLTAAHCFLDIDKSKINFVFSTNVAGAKPENIRKVQRVLPHEQFNAVIGVQNALVPSNDIALTAFNGETPAGFSPVSIADLPKPLPATFEIAGFGQQKDGDPSSSGILKTMTALLSGSDEAKRILEFQSVDSDPQGGMPGDSGGPAYLRNGDNLQLAGVLSTQGTSGPENRFNGHNVYTNLGFYRSWLQVSVAKIRDPNFRPDPIQSLSYLIGKVDNSTYSVGVTNNGPEFHACTIRVSANVLLSTGEKSMDLSLKNSPYAAQTSEVALVRLEGKSSHSRGNFANIFAMRPETGKVVGNFMITSQCDEALPSPQQKAEVTSQVQAEL